MAPHLEEPATDELGTVLERLADDVDTIRAWWPALADDRIPGTRRRHVADQDPEQRTFRTDCPDCGWPMAWLVTSRQPYCTRPHNTSPGPRERAMPACTTARALGFSPASVRVDVVDDIAEAAARLQYLEAALREDLADGARQAHRGNELGARVLSVDRGPYGPLPRDVAIESRGHDTVWLPPEDALNPEERGVDWLRTREHKVHVSGWRLVGGYLTDQDVAAALAYIATAVQRISDPTQARRVRAALTPIIGLVRHAAAAGRRAARVPRPCPICERMTLVVLEAVYDPDTGHSRADFPTQRRHVLCAAAGCRCDREDCECRDGRPHRWTEDQWERLGLVITTVDETIRTSV